MAFDVALRDNGTGFDVSLSAVGGVSVSPAASTAVGTSINPTVILSVPDIFITPNPSTAVGAGVNPVLVLGSLTLSPAARTGIGQTINPAVVLGSLLIIPAWTSAPGRTVAPNVIQSGLFLTPEILAAVGATVEPTVVLGSLFIDPGVSSGIGATSTPTVIIGTPVFVQPTPAISVGKTWNPIVLPLLSQHDTRVLGSINSSAGLYLGADSTGNLRLTGALDLVRFLKGRALSLTEAADHRQIILGEQNGSAYPEVGTGLGQYWAFMRLAQYYFLSNDPGAQEILENWLAWLDAYTAPEGSGWQVPIGFSEYGFTYGSYEPGAAASIALGCLYTYLRGGQPLAATWARRFLDDLRLNRQSQEFGGGYKSDRHYAWLNALVVQAFGVAAFGLAGQAYPFASLPEDAAHFDSLMAWLFTHAGDAKPNILNADLMPFTYLEAGDLWDYVPHYLAVGQMGSLEAVVLMLGAALAYGQGRGDWSWFDGLWRFILQDNLVALDASHLKTLTAAYQVAGVKNLVRVYWADYDQDNTRYCELRDETALAAWGEAAVDLDLRYDAPVVLENAEVAQLLAARLLQRLSSPWEMVHLETWLEGARLEIGDTLAVTSPFHGFTREEFTVFGKTVDLKKRRVSLDLARPIGLAWSWAVDVEGSDYDASAIDQGNRLDANWDHRGYAV